jgi:GDP-L-fucose synthase
MEVSKHLITLNNTRPVNRSSRIYVAGHNGLVGSAIRTCLEQKGYKNIIFRTFEELDLTNQKATEEFFAAEQPEYVFLAAALVGGIMANNTFRADFIYQNILVQSNVIHSSWKYKVKKLLFLGSTCIYPKNALQPLKEEYLLTSPLEFTNEPYAIAKIAGLKMCESFNLQYNTNFISVMPTNLYGPGDNFNLEKSHVLPALLRKIYLGKCLEDDNWDGIRKDLNKYPIEKISENSAKDHILKTLEKFGIILIDGISMGGLVSDSKPGMSDVKRVVVNVWGTGTPLREFMYSPDMAAACVFVMENADIKDIVEMHHQSNRSDFHPPHFINIGTGEEVSINELALKIKKLTGYKGEIVFDKSKPDGTMRKTIDISLLKQLGFTHKFDLEAGLKATISAYLD